MRIRPCALAAGLAAAVVVPAVPARAAGSGTTVTFDLKEVTTGIEFDDQGTPGPGVGDTLTYRTDLTDTRTGRPSGAKVGTCHTALARSDGHLLALCTETLTLPGTTLTSVGIVDQTALPTGAVQRFGVVGTGGTHAGWTGVEEYRATVYPTEFATTVRLTRR